MSPLLSGMKSKQHSHGASRGSQPELFPAEAPTPAVTIHPGCLPYLDKITCGNAWDLLPLLPRASIDAIITDPPYNMGKGKWDVWTLEMAENIVTHAVRLLTPHGSLYLFGKKEVIASMWNAFTPLTPRWLTWYYRNSSNINHNTWGWNSQVIVFGHRGAPIFHLDAARIPYSAKTNTSRVNHDDTTSRFGIHKNGKSQKHYNDLGRKPMDVIECPAVTAGIAHREGVWHPTQKPLTLIKTLVSVSTDPGMVVLDPFCGGATLPVAARSLRRHWIAFEQDPLFVAKGRDRLAQQ